MAVVLCSLACFNFYTIKAYLLSFLILCFLHTFILSVGNLLWVLHCHNYISIAYFTAKLYNQYLVLSLFLFLMYSNYFFNLYFQFSLLHIFKDSTTICDSIFFSRKVCFWRHFAHASVCCTAVDISHFITSFHSIAKLGLLFPGFYLFIVWFTSPICQATSPKNFLGEDCGRSSFWVTFSGSENRHILPSCLIDS